MSYNDPTAMLYDNTGSIHPPVIGAYETEYIGAFEGGLDETMDELVASMLISQARVSGGKPNDVLNDVLNDVPKTKGELTSFEHVSDKLIKIYKNIRKS